MSLVAVMSIVFGLVVVLTRGSMLFVPATTLRWTNWALADERRRQRCGAALMAMGALMIWAGWRQTSLLATVLLVFGIGVVLFAAVGLLLFPGGFRSLSATLEPDDPIGTLMGWRIMGLGGLVIGGLFVYFGALSLVG